MTDLARQREGEAAVKPQDWTAPDWHDSGCGKWEGKDLFGEPLAFPCDCGLPDALREAHAAGRAEALGVAVAELEALGHDISNAIAGLTEGQRRFFMRRVKSAIAALTTTDEVK